MTTINLSYLEKFSRGNNGFILRIIDEVLTTVPAALQRMEEAEQAGNWEVVRAVAHSLATSIEIIGREDLKAKVEDLEKKAAKQEGLDNLPDLVHEVVTSCKAALEDLQTVKEELQKQKYDD